MDAPGGIPKVANPACGGRPFNIVISVALASHSTWNLQILSLVKRGKAAGLGFIGDLGGITEHGQEGEKGVRSPRHN
jgi:hypothetical protein